MFWFGDATFVLLIPAILLSLYAQWKVSAAFRKYSQVPSRRGMTGAEVAQAILRGQGTAAGVEPGRAGQASQGVSGVTVEPGQGFLSDFFDPTSGVLRLSEEVYASTSVAAVSVAAHEVGHALQRAVNYPFLGLRSLAAPLANFGSMLAFPILIIGMIFGMFTQALNVAIVLYLAVVFFTLVTLPVEFNASRRALLVLENGGYLGPDELPGAREVLNAAALTYVAAAASAVITLLRLFLLRNMSSND